MSTTRIAFALSIVALALSIWPYIRPNPEVSVILLRDLNTGERIGVIKAEYGHVEIACFDKDNRTDLYLRPQAVAIKFGRGASTLATWTLNADGEKFERHNAPSQP